MLQLVVDGIHRGTTAASGKQELSAAVQFSFWNEKIFVKETKVSSLQTCKPNWRIDLGILRSIFWFFFIHFNLLIHVKPELDSWALRRVSRSCSPKTSWHFMSPPTYELNHCIHCSCSKGMSPVISMYLVASGSWKFGCQLHFVAWYDPVIPAHRITPTLQRSDLTFQPLQPFENRTFNRPSTRGTNCQKPNSWLSPTSDQT